MPTILNGDTVRLDRFHTRYSRHGNLVLGSSFLSRMKRRTKNATKTTGRVIKRSAKTTGRVAVRTVKSAGHGVATAGRAIGHVAMMAERLATRIVRRAAKKVLLHGLNGVELLGADGTPTMSKTAATATLMPAATAAVAASPAAPAAPLVPVIVSKVIDEIFSAIKGGKSKADIANALGKGDSPLGIPKVIWIGGGLVLAGIIVFSATRRKKV